LSIFFFCFRSFLDNFVHFSSFAFVHSWTILSLAFIQSWTILSIFSFLAFVHSCSFFFDKLIDLILFKSSNIFRNFGKMKKK
jgi:hypothetical protein